MYCSVLVGHTSFSSTSFFFLLVFLAILFLLFSIFFSTFYSALLLLDVGKQLFFCTSLYFFFYLVLLISRRSPLARCFGASSRWQTRKLSSLFLLALASQNTLPGRRWPADGQRTRRKDANQRRFDAPRNQIDFRARISRCTEILQFFIQFFPLRFRYTIDRNYATDPVGLNTRM